MGSKATVITEENEAAVRAELAALEAQRNRERIEAQNAERATARAAVQPVADLLAAETLDIAALETARAALPASERGLDDLCRSLCRVTEAARDLAARRIADTEPTPAPEA